MKMCITSIIFAVFLLSCNKKEIPDSKQGTMIKVENNSSIDSSVRAKEWLVKSIEEYFAEFDQRGGDYSALCSPEYREFKEDATNVDMDGGMDEVAFGEKWGKESIELAGLREGFLIGGNDFGKIRVKKAEFLERTEEGGFLFEVIIEDFQYESFFKREILVIPFANSFLIDNVYEIENVFKQE